MDRFDPNNLLSPYQKNNQKKPFSLERPNNSDPLSFNIINKGGKTTPETIPGTVPQTPPGTTTQGTQGTQQANPLQAALEAEGGSSGTSGQGLSDEFNKASAEGGIDMNYVDQLAAKQMAAQLAYGQQIEEERMTDRTRKGIGIADKGMEEASYLSPLGSFLMQQQQVNDAQGQAINAAAAGGAGGAFGSGGDVVNSQAGMAQVANAVTPISAQFASQRAQNVQDLFANKAMRNELIEKRNQDAISHSNTREMVSKDHPLRALMFEMNNKQAAMNYAMQEEAAKKWNYERQLQQDKEKK